MLYIPVLLFLEKYIKYDSEVIIDTVLIKYYFWLPQYTFPELMLPISPLLQNHLLYAFPDLWSVWKKSY